MEFKKHSNTDVTHAQTLRGQQRGTVDPHSLRVDAVQFDLHSHFGFQCPLAPICIRKRRTQFGVLGGVGAGAFHASRRTPTIGGALALLVEGQALGVRRATAARVQDAETKHRVGEQELGDGAEVGVAPLQILG